MLENRSRQGPGLRPPVSSVCSVKTGERVDPRQIEPLTGACTSSKRGGKPTSPMRTRAG
jgi:hypothetical protein